MAVGVATEPRSDVTLQRRSTDPSQVKLFLSLCVPLSLSQFFPNVRLFVSKYRSPLFSSSPVSRLTLFKSSSLFVT